MLKWDLLFGEGTQVPGKEVSWGLSIPLGRNVLLGREWGDDGKDFTKKEKSTLRGTVPHKKKKAP